MERATSWPCTTNSPSRMALCAASWMVTPPKKGTGWVAGSSAVSARYRRALASSRRASTLGARSGWAAMRWAWTGPRSMVGSGSARPHAKSAYSAGASARCRLVSPSVQARPRVGACGSGTASSSPTSRRATASRAARVAGRSSGTAAALTRGWDGSSVFMAASKRPALLHFSVEAVGRILHHAVKSRGGSLTTVDHRLLDPRVAGVAPVECLRAHPADPPQPALPVARLRAEPVCRAQAPGGRGAGPDAPRGGGPAQPHRLRDHPGGARGPAPPSGDAARTAPAGVRGPAAAVLRRPGQQAGPARRPGRHQPAGRAAAARRPPAGPRLPDRRRALPPATPPHHAVHPLLRRLPAAGARLGRPGAPRGGQLADHQRPRPHRRHPADPRGPAPARRPADRGSRAGLHRAGRHRRLAQQALRGGRRGSTGQPASISGADRARPRGKFNQAAELDDRARPGYPPSLSDELTRVAAVGPGCRVLEIGCRTGQATVPLAERAAESSRSSSARSGRRSPSQPGPLPRGRGGRDRVRGMAAAAGWYAVLVCVPSRRRWRRTLLHPAARLNRNRLHSAEPPFVSVAVRAA